MQGIKIILRLQGSMSTYLMLKERQIKPLHFSFSSFVNRWELYSFGWSRRHFLSEIIC